MNELWSPRIQSLTQKLRAQGFVHSQLSSHTHNLSFHFSLSLSLSLSLSNTSTHPHTCFFLRHSYLIQTHAHLEAHSQLTRYSLAHPNSLPTHSNPCSHTHTHSHSHSHPCSHTHTHFVTTIGSKSLEIRLVPFNPFFQ